jgi:hypothetical protein
MVAGLRGHTAQGAHGDSHAIGGEAPTSSWRSLIKLNALLRDLDRLLPGRAADQRTYEIRWGPP